MNIPAIPTMYNGIQFRSRLEAKWAAMFDLLNWRYEYEALDLDGYIPDFILQFYQPMIGEIKPALTTKECETYAPKIDASGWEDEALIFGATINLNNDTGCFATYKQVAGKGGAHQWDAAYLFKCLVCGEYSLQHASWRWVCVVNGCYDGNAHIHYPDPRDIESMWRQAGNAVQYRNR